MNWYLEVLKKYAVFNGRASRKEYWMFFLFNIIFTFAMYILDNILGTTTYNGFGLFQISYGLVVFIPGCAVLVRRLHDVGESSWMLLILLIPIVGSIWLLILLIINSNSGENKYGPNPKVKAPFIKIESFKNIEEKKNKRPILITIIAWFLIIAGVISWIYNVSVLNNIYGLNSSFSGRYLMVYFIFLVSIVTGVGMLKAQNVARILFIAYGIKFLIDLLRFLIYVFTGLPDEGSFALSIVCFIVIVVFLFQPKANQYFSKNIRPAE